MSKSSTTDIESTKDSTVIDLETAAKTAIIPPPAPRQPSIMSAPTANDISQRSPSPANPEELEPHTTPPITVSASRARSESSDKNVRVLEFLTELLETYPDGAKYPPIDDTIDPLGQNDVDEE